MININPYLDIYLQRKDRSEQSTVANWIVSLSTLQFEEKQYQTFQIAAKASGTGEWFLNSQEFTDWRDGGLRNLWCYGIRKINSRAGRFLQKLTVILAGAGKTVLAYDPVFDAYYFDSCNNT